MADTKTITMAVIMVLLAGGGTFIGSELLGQDNTYFCEPLKMVKVCDKLSSTQSRCYIGTSYKDCKGSVWEKIVGEIPDVVIDVPTGNTNAQAYLCSTTGCVPK